MWRCASSAKSLSSTTTTGSLFLSLAVKALIASVFPIFLFIWDFEKLPRFVPFVLTLAISTLLLTQALRHDPKVFSQRRFRTASLLVTAGLLLIILIISSPEFLRLVAMIPGLIYEWIIAPIILVFSYVVGGLVYLISRPLSGLFASRPDTKLKTFGFQDGFMELIFSFVNTPTTSILDVVKPIVTIAIVIAVLVFSASCSRGATTVFDTTRSRRPAPPSPKNVAFRKKRRWTSFPLPTRARQCATITGSF